MKIETTDTPEPTIQDYRNHAIRVACDAILESLPEEGLKEALETLTEILKYHMEML